MVRRVRRVRLVVGTIACAALAGCGTSGHGAQPPPPSAPVADAAAVARQGAIAAYEGMWTDMAKAGETANWHDPVLATHATDSALSTMVKLLQEDEKLGAVLKGGPPVMHPKVVSAEPSSVPTVVTVSDCLGMQHWLLYRKATGQPWDDKPGTSRATKAEIVLSQGTWKVEGFDVAGLSSC